MKVLIKTIINTICVILHESLMVFNAMMLIVMACWMIYGRMPFNVLTVLIYVLLLLIEVRMIMYLTEKGHPYMPFKPRDNYTVIPDDEN